MWESTAEGAHLRGRATRDTQPERALRAAVHRQGFRFRLNRRIGRYRPDFVLPRHRVAVFVDGCFWHNCPQHGPSEFRGPNAVRWREKLAANRTRDLAANAVLAEAGWTGVRVWECEIRRDPAVAAMKVITATQVQTGDASSL